MPHATQRGLLQEAEVAARLLSTLIQSASVVQLLQHPPPAAMSKQQQDLLQNCTYTLIRVMSALSQLSATVPAEQVRWLQQRMRSMCRAATGRHRAHGLCITVTQTWVHQTGDECSALFQSLTTNALFRHLRVRPCVCWCFIRRSVFFCATRQCTVQAPC
jgi:hypothetical protein